jgi:hypothetical protein
VASFYASLIRRYAQYLIQDSPNNQTSNTFKTIGYKGKEFIFTVELPHFIGEKNVLLFLRNMQSIVSMLMKILLMELLLLSMGKA